MRMKSSKLSLVPFQLASLCLDCEMITAANGRCIACGSMALLNIARTLSKPGTLPLSRMDGPSVAQIASGHQARNGDFVHST